MRIISGKYGRRRFDVPTNITARPTTDMARENLFNVLNNFIDFDGITALDLFAGTGAISFELLSRGAVAVTAVEMARTQTAFINKVKATLADDNLTVVKGDVFKFLDSCTRRFDLIFADPPYDLPRFADVPRLVLESPVMGPGSIFVMEHPREHDFSALPHFIQHRAYGKVNFTIFSRPE
ncbi:MAG: RsmD family RNA methyltransferase [Muribaculaceae bacterium]|nr:RsmD family RNA methyltransferase [Muribaculaceae bacterium]